MRMLDLSTGDVNLNHLVKVGFPDFFTIALLFLIRKYFFGEEIF
jgi:hypothetical protein